MKHLNKQYRSGITGLLIAIYIFSLVAAIFHYHHLQLSVNGTVVSEENEISSHFQVIFDNNYECIVQHNLSNLQTSLLCLFNVNQIIRSEYIQFKNCNCQFCITHVILDDNLLRAPPSLS